MNDTADVYTPVLRTSGVRLMIRNPVYEDGFKQGRGLGTKGVIRDPETGKRYLISGKACDLENCLCDAWAVDLSD